MEKLTVTVEPPIRTLCAWCPKDQPPTVIVDVPLDGRGVSHGICPKCTERWLTHRSDPRR